MKVDEIEIEEYRRPEAEVEDLFVERWSPRAMSGEPVSEGELAQLFEAARWAPSSYNRQPWRFLWTRRGDAHWDLFFDLLVEFNQSWADGAGALLAIVSRRRTEEGKQITTHSFDAGAAWQNLALQGSRMGLVIHAMEGFDKERARRRLEVPDDWQIEAMIAVGHPGRIDELPDELEKREKPSDRKPLDEVASPGPFPAG